MVTLELAVEGETAIQGSLYVFVSSDLTVKSGVLTGGNFYVSTLFGKIIVTFPETMDTINAVLAAGIPLPTDI